MGTAILPEKFESGDFVNWLRVFDVCPAANEWDADANLEKLPAFLQGPALAYYTILMATNRSNYGNLITNLKALICTVATREQYFQEFKIRSLRSE